MDQSNMIWNEKLIGFNSALAEIAFRQNTVDGKLTSVCANN